MFSEEKIREKLKESTALIGLTSDQLEAIARAGRLETFDDLQQIIHRDAPDKALYIILDGRVLVEGENDLTLTTLSSEMTLQEQYEGDFFGEMAIVDHEPRSANVFSVGPTTTFVIEKEDLHHLFADDTALQVVILTNLARILSRRIRRGNLKRAGS